MVRQHHQFKGHEFETLEDSGGQRKMACCSPRGHRESDTICGSTATYSLDIL